MNKLSNEQSPYLKQHAENPVEWWPWSQEAITAAQKNDKPILLSVGYSACHWCHVMAHESFEDPATANIMNEHFINIKVDREERPDLDAIYQKSLALMGEQGGWPLTMFLTPELTPFFGGTYFPPSPRYGMPDFKTVLNHINQVYSENKNLVRHNVEAISQALDNQFNSARENKTTLPPINDLITMALSRADPVNGGTMGAPKFPQIPLLNFLWHFGLKTNDKNIKNHVLLTMTRMSLGGIHDHLLGGYARYSTDPLWFAPHFEKMLYDNALILELLADLYRDKKNPLWYRRAEQLVTWLEGEMVSDEGAFFSALDADSEGKEGQFYIWQKTEVESALGDDAQWLCDLLNIVEKGNWHEGGEGANILYLDHPETDLSANDQQKLSALVAKLIKIRARRVRPGLDNKILADWNGMMIAALAKAGEVFQKPHWIERATTAYTAICDTMQKDGRKLVHSRCNSANSTSVFLDDYAQMARAALTLFKVTGKDDFLKQAQNWVEEVKIHFSRKEGGFFTTGDDVKSLIIRPIAYEDYATPSGNAIIAGVLVQLSLFSGNTSLRSDLFALFDGLRPFVAQYPLSSPALLMIEDIFTNQIHVSIIGNDKEAVKELKECAYTTQIPGLFVTIHESGAKLPERIAKTNLKTAEKDKSAVALVCYKETCSLPLATNVDLTAELNHLKTLLEASNSQM